METTPRQYTQAGAPYFSACEHMIRFYASHQDALPDELSPASSRAWNAVRTVMTGSLSAYSRGIVLQWARMDWQQSRAVPNHYWESIKLALRLVAIEYGLADAPNRDGKGGENHGKTATANQATGRTDC